MLGWHSGRPVGHAIGALLVAMAMGALQAVPAQAAVSRKPRPHVGPVLAAAHRPHPSRQPKRQAAPSLSPRTLPKTTGAVPGVTNEGRVSPATATDDLSTTAATFDPTNPFNVFVSTNLVSDVPHVVGFTNAATGFWEPVDLPRPDQQPNDYAYDTAVAYDNRGELYDAYMTYQVLDPNTGAVATQLVVARSTDKGLDWNHPVQIDGPANTPEKPGLTVDRSNGPHRNRIYVAYDSFPPAGPWGANPIMISHSDDGMTWSFPNVVHDFGRDFGAQPVVDGQGNVFVAWHSCWGSPPCGDALYGQVVVARSVDGDYFPTTVSVSKTTAGVDGINRENYGDPANCGGTAQRLSPTPGIDVDRSGGTYNGTLYVLWSDSDLAPGNFGMHIFFSRSSDGGATWSQRTQLDVGNPNDAWQPTIAVDQSTGVVTAAWYDRRDDPGNALYRVYAAQSTDGGQTFGRPFSLASQSSDPRTSCLGTGDGIQMIARNGGAEVFWTDSRNGINQTFGATIDAAAVAQAALAPALSFKTANYPLVGPPLSVAGGDFTGDGKPDAAVASGSGVQVFPNTGDGSFATAVTTNITLSYPAPIATGDFNKDGKLDLAIASQTGLWILIGKGDGSFQPAAKVAGSVTPQGLVVADFSNDGKVDIAVTDPGLPGVQLFLGNGDGTFLLASSAFPAGNPLQCTSSSLGTSIVAGHFTGLYEDLAYTFSCTEVGGSSPEGFIILYPGNGNGTFQPSHVATSFGVGMPQELVTGKLAGLSDYDAAAVIDEGGDHVEGLLGMGNGMLARGPAVAVGQGLTDLGITDLNSDGLGDLVVAAQGSGGLRMMFGNGDGTFGPARPFDMANSPFRLTAGDFGGDSRPDVIAAGGNPGSLTAFISKTISASPASVAFGSTVIGTSSAAQTVTFTNNASAPARIALAQVRSSEFAKTADTCSGTVLAPSASCTVAAQYTPIVPGPTATSIEIVDDASGSPQLVRLTATGVASTRTIYQVASRDQYQLVSSDGQAWTDLDTSGLSLMIVPSADSTAIIGGNADLWTAEAGYNQDLGIAVGNGLIGWKESGGFAGTYSPNAAFVEGRYDMKKDTIYQVKLVWKTNRDAINSTIFAGAGSAGKFSPTQLTVRLQPASTVSVVTLKTQPSMSANDGSAAAWTDIDPTLHLGLQSSVATTATLGGNADLWTARPGFNQDLGIFVSGGAYGPGQLVAWKESGGFAGTFSPNAAYVQAVIALAPNTAYTVTLKWKANKPVGAKTIFSGAGPIGSEYSPTTLTAVMGPAQTAAGTAQFTHPASSTSDDWQPFGSGINLTLPASADGMAIVSGNVDLWTTRAGYNQDVAIFVSDNGAPVQLIAWKESGGFAGTYSPNAAYVQALLPLSAGHSYTFELRWKANRPAPAGTIYAGAGPLGGLYSPTSLVLQLTPK